jgi:glycosyltransferase involved in cell wall biosynthesis
MEYNDRVSVVMPVHNGEKFLREAIESVLNQTYTNFEFLLIENCSTDSSVEIIKSYNDQRIKLIVEEDCGIVQGYNRGFKEAKGEYIIVHDQDDISLPERIESQLYFLTRNKLDLCGSSFSIVNEIAEKVKNSKENKPIDESCILFNKREIDASYIIFFNILYDYYVTTVTLLINVKRESRS